MFNKKNNIAVNDLRLDSIYIVLFYNVKMRNLTERFILIACVPEQRSPGVPVFQWQCASSYAVAVSPARPPLLCGRRLGDSQHS